MCYCGGCERCLMAQGYWPEETCTDCGEDISGCQCDELDDQALADQQALESYEAAGLEETEVVFDELVEMGLDLADIDLDEFRLWVESHEAAYADVDRLAEVA